VDHEPIPAVEAGADDTVDRCVALTQLLDAEPMAVPDPADLKVELDEIRLRRR
jgi:hypothetical protein